MNYVEAFVRLINNEQKENMTVCEVGVYAADTSVEYLPIIKKKKIMVKRY